MIWGILMFICGLIAIALPLISSIGIVILLAWVILFAGVSHLIFAFHARGVGSVLWQILLAVLYIVAGIYLLINPLLGVVSLTLVLAVFLVLEGIIEIALYFGLRGVAALRVGAAGWNHHAYSGHPHLAAMAVEFCLGNRNPDRHQPDFQRHLQGHAFAGCPARRSGRRLIGLLESVAESLDPDRASQRWPRARAPSRVNAPELRA